MVLLEIPSEYGYVILTGLSSVILTTYLGVKTTGARKTYGVEYPYMYASREEVEKDKKKHVFNCIQRAHQNTLENYPQFLLTLTFGGLKHPIISAVAGGVWLLGRIFYAAGYSTGEPDKRFRGAFGYLATFALMGTTISTGYSLLNYY